MRETEREIAAIGEVKYREETPVSGSGIVGTFGTGAGNTNYSVLDVGNSGAKLNADYTVEMTLRVTDVDRETQIGGASGAFFGMGCENFTVGFDFATNKWGVSPTGGLFASYAFHPSEIGTTCVLDDGYFHTVTFDCSTTAIRVFVDGSCVLNATSLVRENNKYCIFYPRLCTVEFLSYAFKYNGSWVNDHLTGGAIVSASTWRDRGSGYGSDVQSFVGSKLVDSLRAIEYAEGLYDALSPNEKTLVSNHRSLVDARDAYELLSFVPPIANGDIDGDGHINAADLLAIMRFIVGYSDPGFDESRADYNGDERINNRDVLGMMLDIVNGVAA